MEDLTFGEQVKIILGRKGMTIKQLAELIEKKTGKKMSRQNLTQRLGRDNFQEQDMRMIAAILECPFQLSIMSADVQAKPRSTASLEKAATARTDAVDRMSEQERAELAKKPETALLEETALPEEETALPEEETAAAPDSGEMAALPEEETAAAPDSGEGAVLLEEEKAAAPESGEETALPEEESAAVPDSGEVAAAPILREEHRPAQEESAAPAQTEEAPGERDMTIGELYDMHKELEHLEESARAGEPVEEIKKELEKPKREGFFSGGFFLRRKKPEEKKQEKEQTEERTEDRDTVQAGSGADGWNPDLIREEPDETEQTDFEPVIRHDDEAEDAAVGEVNPYTGKEYQSNSVRMHPTRIGYVQVYDRTIHKWTDMTEWAFLGLQERKKALLGKAYEPPIYLD